MRVLSHRGYWKAQEEKNSMNALENALKLGYGFESDIRDYCGDLVISHDVADYNSLRAEKIFSLLNNYNNEFCFAINVKADGLISRLHMLLNKYNVENYFCFDMSVPQMIEYCAAGIRFFTRQSEYEHELVLYKEAAGVWIDAFVDYRWITPEVIRSHLKNGKDVCLVSPDLHKKDNSKFWQILKNTGLGKEDIYICTDMPDEARMFFGE